MTTQLDDHTDAPATIGLDDSDPIGAYIVRLGDGTRAGAAYFADAPAADGERMFFHTEVAAAFSGRGLPRLLVREALADTVAKNLTVVPVCPLFAAHIKRHGDEFLGAGGRFRQPTRNDVTLVKRLMTSERFGPAVRRMTSPSTAEATP